MAEEERRMAEGETAVLVLPLDDDGATLERVGGKGASLARLARAGLPVPPGFHVTTAAYRRFVAANGLQAAIEAAAGAADATRPRTLERAEAHIRALFADGALPEEVARAIGASYAALGADLAMAVRSSATAEDLPDLSFAGQQESYLNVRGEGAVLDAVRRCWASLWTARAIGYRAVHGIAPGDVSLAVVVQELAPAEAAGVLFTADPVTGARDRAVISAAWGLGEAVVGGLVTPDSLTVDKESGAVLDARVADKAVMTVRTAEGTRTEPTPRERRRRAALGSEQAVALTRLGMRIERLYGQPMDVEWTLHDGAFAIVQARPITALPEPPAGASPPLDWTPPHPRGLYLRGSVIELLPDPLSPLFATLALSAWNAAMVDLGRRLGITFAIPDDMITTINGYAYGRMGGIDFSLAQKARLVDMAPRLARMVWRSRPRWDGDARPAYAAVVARWASRDLATAPAGQLLDGAREIVAAAARHYLVIQTGVLMASYISEALFTAVYDRLIKRDGDPPALTFLLGYASTPIRAEQSLYDLAMWARGQDELAAYLTRTPGARIAAALDGAAPEGVPEDGWREFRRRLREHLARFGHAIYDLDFAKETPADNPAPLLETLAFFLSGQGADPHARRAAAAARRSQATRAVLQHAHGPRRAVFRRLLAPAQRFAPLREDALGDVGLGWPLLRRILAELGRRLTAAGVIARAEDVYWLSDDDLREMASALDAGRPLEPRRAEVAERRALWVRERQATPPVALPLRSGTASSGKERSRRTPWMPTRTEQDPDGLIRGIGASPGRVSATARVLHGPEEFGQLRPGDILVARITTPAWTPLFALAAGVVTDVGGPLSHSSIVAREYHIPAVLGTGVATERLRSGQRIVVDGDAGTVTLQP